jgi:drug/metabolite transporter (DMT)-like permease
VQVHEPDSELAEPARERLRLRVHERGIEGEIAPRAGELDHLGALAGVPQDVAARDGGHDVAHMAVDAAAQRRHHVQDGGSVHERGLESASIIRFALLRSPVSLPTLGLLAGATLWGLVWYPYRLLAQAGIDGLWSTLFTYGLALVVGVAVFPRHARILRRIPPLAMLMGLAIGWSNLAYVLGVLEGEVMRVLLLFYLAPLWTVPMARFLLDERLDARGFAVMALAFVGAMAMLWRPELGFPWPASRAEWLGLFAGVLFALGNVLVRRLEDLSDASKSIVIWAGVTVAALLHLPGSKVGSAQAWSLAWDHGALVAAIGLALLLMGLALQYGLSRMPANRAIVILLFELVVAAFAASWLAGESMRLQDWIGGAFIVLATVVSAKPGTDPKPGNG